MIDDTNAIAPTAFITNTYLLDGSLNGGTVCNAGLNGNSKPISPPTNKPIPIITACRSTIRKSSSKSYLSIDEPKFNRDKKSTNVLLIEQNL